MDEKYQNQCSNLTKDLLKHTEGQHTSSALRIEVTPEMNTSSQKSEQVFSN